MHDKVERRDARTVYLKLCLFDNGFRRERYVAQKPGSAPPGAGGNDRTLVARPCCELVIELGDGASSPNKRNAAGSCRSACARRERVDEQRFLAAPPGSNSPKHRLRDFPPRAPSSR